MFGIIGDNEQGGGEMYRKKDVSVLGRCHRLAWGSSTDINSHVSENLGITLRMLF